jgi:UDP-galactopyranose mutase
MRWDDDPYVFPDSYQGWPMAPHGCTDLMDGLLPKSQIELRTDRNVTSASFEARLRDVEPDAIVLTCPLDISGSAPYGELERRGILVPSVHSPLLEYSQRAMVVSYLGHDCPFIRVHETDYASGQQFEDRLLGFEFTDPTIAQLRP